MFKYPILILALTLVLLMSPKTAQAAGDLTVVINEVMANAASPEDKLEWVELYNNSAIAVNLNGWSFDGDSKIISNPLAIIPVEGFLILARNKDEFLKYYPDFDPAVSVIQASFVLSNGGDTIVLKNSDGSYMEEFAWMTDTGDRFSRERVDSQISGDDNWKVTLTQDGTPGVKNSVSDILPPSSVTLLSPTDNQNLTDLESIELSWENHNVQAVTFELIVSQNADLTDPIIDEPNLTNTDYLIEELAIGNYYWQVIVTNGVSEVKSIIWQFEITNPVYSDNIIINELMADPSGDETDGEWIELFNNSDTSVNLKDWILEDIKGSIHRFVIKDDLLIDPKSYEIFYRKDTGITLNNDQDGVRLYQPDENPLYETAIFSDGEEDWSWARKTSGSWSWTAKITPLKTNSFYLPEPEEEAVGGGEEDPVIPVNLVPIKTKTGSYRNYQYKRVEVEGQVVETSGNTFYLDDGSGRAKIYIQDKTGIDKPKMGKGDIFWVSGIVNLYRTTWRILPQIQSDIKLIQAAIKPEKEAETKAKASTAKKAAASSSKKSVATASTARAPNQIIPQVKAAEDGVNSKTKVKAATPIWMQIVEVITSLAGIFLVLLIIRVIKVPKPKVIGGKFGEDDT